MELYEIKQGLEKYQNKLDQLRQVMQLPVKQALIDDLNNRQMAEDFWSDQRQAQKLISQLNNERDLVNSFMALDQHLSTLTSDFQGLKDSFDVEMQQLFEEDYQSFEQQFSEFEIKVLLSGQYDHNDCIIEIHPGAGGTESQDWAQMLYRMYNRFANRHGYKLAVVDYQDGDTAGIKSVTFQMSGDLAFGYLKCERGVHRLVRISPFDSSGRRHTSFASVEVTPVFDDDIVVEIDMNDVLLETHRASGAGGQHVNKTDSAVRLTHLPTGIVVNVQSERSQLNNREQALKIMKARIYQRMLEEQEAKMASMKGDQKAIEWGSQIRSYVFCPYTMVKDHRTNYETSAVDKVMDGEIDEFIYHYLKTQATVEE